MSFYQEFTNSPEDWYRCKKGWILWGRFIIRSLFFEEFYLLPSLAASHETVQHNLFLDMFFNIYLFILKQKIKSLQNLECLWKFFTNSYFLLKLLSYNLSSKKKHSNFIKLRDSNPFQQFFLFELNSVRLDIQKIQILINSLLF